MEALAVGDEGDELPGEPGAQLLDGGGELLLADLLVLHLLVVGAEALPREGPLQEVDENVPDGLEVVPPALLDAEMSVDRGVPRGAG